MLAQHEKDQAERALLEQRLATQAAEQRALELKSQLYASIGIMAGSYAHNIKNLLVRPNDLLNRCLEADGLATEQQTMLHEVKQTLGTVTKRLQQILPRSAATEPFGANAARSQRGGVRNGTHLEGVGSRQMEDGNVVFADREEMPLPAMCRIYSRRWKTCSSMPAMPPSRCVMICVTQARRLDVHDAVSASRR